jgi:hypothetical protein
MGFMDKAKKLAEQAQQKLDEAQQKVGQSGSPQAGGPEGGVRYDEHGRPIQETPAPGAAQAPSAPAPPAAPAPDPAAPHPAEEQQAAEPPPPPPPPPAESGGGDQANASPDPFKPLQQ